MSKKPPGTEKPFHVVRTGELDFKFTGVLLSDVERQTALTLTEVARIYRTSGGAYIAEHIRQERHPTKEVSRALQCRDAAAIVEFFTITPDEKKPKKRHVLDVGKDALAEAGTVDTALTDSHVEVIP